MEEEREIKSKEKIKEVDYIKGIAIILVFVGHAATPSFLERPYNYEFLVQMIYSMHMPLFFMVSGFLSYKIKNMKIKKDYFKYLKNKLIRLGVPFLTFSLITNGLIIISDIFISKTFKVSNILSVIKTTILYPEDGVMGALWFLYTLLIISMIAPLIIKLPKKILILGAILLNILIPKYINFLSFSRITFFLIYFLMGLYFREYYNKRIGLYNNSEYKISKFKYSKVINIFIPLVLIITYSYLISNNINVNEYLLNVLNLLCGSFGVILVLELLRFIRVEWALKKLELLGKYSMDIYLLSWFFQIASMVFITKILKITNYSLFFISNLIVGSLCLPFSIFIIRRFNIFKFLLFGEIKDNRQIIVDKNLSSNF